ncbi:hypothetical protein TNCV_2705221 [Trichonephila clavipes]|nr:hypothetical protein TNCV_2705221 [Trichonephila clavipes]
MKYLSCVSGPARKRLSTPTLEQCPIKRPKIPFHYYSTLLTFLSKSSRKKRQMARLENVQFCNGGVLQFTLCMKYTRSQFNIGARIFLVLVHFEGRYLREDSNPDPMAQQLASLTTIVDGRLVGYLKLKEISSGVEWKWGEVTTSHDLTGVQEDKAVFINHCIV